MREHRTQRYLAGAAVLIALMAVSMLSSCKSQEPSGSSAGDGPTVAAAASDQGAAQLWGQNCARCHNMRGPETLSDAQWDIAVHHMRVRANLLATEHEQILKLLKASN